MGLILLDEFQSIELYRLKNPDGTDIVRAPGVYRSDDMRIQGNSLLSSLFIKSADPGATVAVKYYDTTTGQSDGEKYFLAEHPELGTALTTNRLTVTRIHNKPFAEATVTGGNVVFGVYLTVVSSFASDLDQALQFDNSVADLTRDKGMPVMVYDEDLNRFFMLRGDNGVIPVAFSEAGDSVHLTAEDTTTPGIVQDLLVDTVPAGKVRKMTKVRVVCRSHAAYEVTADGATIATGLTSPMRPVDEFLWNPRKDLSENTQVKLSFKAHSSTPSGVGVEAYLMASDVLP